MFIVFIIGPIIEHTQYRIADDKKLYEQYNLPNDGVTFYNIVVFVDILEDHFSETREVFDSDTDKYNVFLEYFDRYVKGGYLARAYEPTSKMFEDELNEAWIHCM